MLRGLASVVPKRLVPFRCFCAGYNEELHRMALQMNQQHHAKLREDFITEGNVPNVAIPRDLRFHSRDPIQIREWKRRQQSYYQTFQDDAYVEDALVKEGFLSQTDLNERREWVRQRVKSEKWKTIGNIRASVSLKTLSLLQDEFDVPEDIRLTTADSAEERQLKVKSQIKFFIQQTTEAMMALPHSRRTVSIEIKKEKKERRDGLKATQEDVELMLLENEELLKKDSPITKDNYLEFATRMHKLQQELRDQTDMKHTIKMVPLAKLDLLLPGALERIDQEIKRISAVEDKRIREFQLRFGEVPSFDDDPFMLEYQEQLKFMKNRIPPPSTDAVTAGQDDAKEKKPEEEAKDKEDEKETDEKGEEDEKAVAKGEDDENPLTPELLGQLAREERKDEQAKKDVFEYQQQRTPRQYLSKEEEDGVEWPRMVDGLDLAKYQRWRDLDYTKFEDPPTQFEVYLMDAFSAQRQMREAKRGNVTLVPRVHIPWHPSDNSVIAKTLLFHRLHAIRCYITELREEKKKAYAIAYRDIKALNLPEIPWDPVNPWKQEVFEEAELILKNQGSWTTAQKEDFMKTLHRALMSELFNQEHHDRGQL